VIFQQLPSTATSMKKGSMSERLSTIALKKIDEAINVMHLMSGMGFRVKQKIK